MQAGPGGSALLGHAGDCFGVRCASLVALTGKRQYVPERLV